MYIYHKYAAYIYPVRLCTFTTCSFLSLPDVGGSPSIHYRRAACNTKIKKNNNGAFDRMCRK